MGLDISKPKQGLRSMSSFDSLKGIDICVDGLVECN